MGSVFNALVDRFDVPFSVDVPEEFVVVLVVPLLVFVFDFAEEFVVVLVVPLLVFVFDFAEEFCFLA
jgi:hypothetical protein